MARRSALRVAVDAGDRVESLTVLRGVLADRLHRAESGSEVAALARQLREVMAEIDALKLRTEESRLDDLAAARAARIAEAQGRERPAVGR